MESDQIRDWLCGPMVAVATPFTEDFTLDLEALHTNVRFMIDGGVRTGQGSLLVGGAGGEHPTLNVEERKLVMSTALEAANGEVPVLSSIQHTDSRVIVELARHASEIGLDGAQLGPTYYYEPTEGDVLRLFELVAKESDVSLMIYHTWWEGLTMSIDLLKRLRDIESVGSLKWSSGDAGHYRQGLLELSDSLVMIDNSGQQTSSHLLGARGFITHLSGFWPAYPLEIWQLLEKRDYAAATARLTEFKWKWSAWIGKVMAVTGGEGPFIKAAMEAVGLTVGPPRPPSVRVPEHLMDELRELLDSANVPKA